MELKDEMEAAATREKLRFLEERYALAAVRPFENEHARAPTLRSLKRLINQLTEELVRYECRQGAASGR